MAAWRSAVAVAGSGGTPSELHGAAPRQGWDRPAGSPSLETLLGTYLPNLLLAQLQRPVWRGLADPTR